MVQARLHELAYDIKVDGVFDQVTAEAVATFNDSRSIAGAGIVSRNTWDALMLSSVANPEKGAGSSATESKDPLLISIDLAKHRLTLFAGEKIIADYPIAVGKSKTPSPLGEWRVVHKSQNWGGGFGTRWMGLNVPWGIYGIHGTNKPGSIGNNASHGCIRMLNKDVEKLFPQVPVGTTVKIVENGKMFPRNLQPVPLKLNDSGQKVVYVQSRLKELRIEFDRADGRYGRMTELAVKYFQVWHDLPPNGRVDKTTYKAMGLI